MMPSVLKVQKMFMHYCFHPKRPQVIICAIVWLVCVSLTLIASALLTVETNYGAEFLNGDYTEEIAKRKHLQNGSVIATSNEVMLCENIERAIYMVSTVFQLCDISAMNFLAAVFMLHSVINSKPLYSIPFFFASFVTTASIIMTIIFSGYWRELLLLSKHQLMYLLSFATVGILLLLSILVPLATYSKNEITKLKLNAAKVATIKHTSCGGLTHTVKAKPVPHKITLPSESSDSFYLNRV